MSRADHSNMTNPESPGEDSTDGTAVGSTTVASNAAANLRVLAICAFVAIAAFMAFGRSSDAVEGASAAAPDRDTAAALAVATSDLVELTAGRDEVSKATGGYIPGVGIVVTAELEQLASDGIVDWATGIVEDSPMVISLLGSEEVVFLLDIASPSRTSRLIALSPSDLDAEGGMTRREAPATSTAPLLPTFDDTPERLASVDEEGNE